MAAPKYNELMLPGKFEWIRQLDPVRGNLFVAAHRWDCRLDDAGYIAGLTRSRIWPAREYTSLGWKETYAPCR